MLLVWLLAVIGAGYLLWREYRDHGASNHDPY